MLGQTVYRIMLDTFPKTTWGTDRADAHFLKFEVEDAERFFTKITKKIGKLDYVINCIGVLRQKDENEVLIRKYIEVNARFPHTLAELAQKEKCKVFHVSTDAVFSSHAKLVDEKDVPTPEDAYGMSKLLGEVKHQNVLNFRSSIIGVDRYKRRGIVEWVKSQRGKVIDGFVNQEWTGSTTLQLATVFKEIITTEQFSALRKKSSVYHFVPLHFTKFELIKQIRAALQEKVTVRRAKGQPIQRVLTTKWKNVKPMNAFYKSSIDQAISEMLL